MKQTKYKAHLLPLLVSLLLLGGCCNPELIGNVPGTLRPQETDNWCWAATTQMLAQHFGITTVTQCALANQRFGRTDCCNLQVPNDRCKKDADCNRPGNLMLDEVGLKFSTTSTARSWEDIRKQVFCAKKPMGYAYGTPGVVGHVLVVKGYFSVGGTNYVVLNDPWAPCDGEERSITYNEYVNPAGSSTHWTTWYDLDKK
jgi:hypothetical protein